MPSSGQHRTPFSRPRHRAEIPEKRTVTQIAVGVTISSLLLVSTAILLPDPDPLVKTSCAVDAHFGRMFPKAAPASWPSTAIDDLATITISDEEPKFTPEGDIDDEENLEVPAGVTYVGQFIDHDITLDPEADNLKGTLDPTKLVNQRTPQLDLDSVYGKGPGKSPALYVDDMHLRLGQRLTGASDTGAVDNLRGSKGNALVGDGRNDENRIVASLHTILMRYHNLAVDAARKADPKASHAELFARAKQQTTWNYQWAVLKDFLPTIVGLETMSDILPNRVPQLRYYDPCTQGIPAEFAMAAYRFGHSMVRPVYRLNTEVKDRLPVFTKSGPNLAGFSPAPGNFAVDWDFFLHTNPKVNPQESYKMDTSLVFPLGLLPLPESVDGVNNLAARNLRRSQQVGLPSGQEVAQAMGVTPLSDEQILIGKATGDPSDVRPITQVSSAFAHKSPLWTYVLAETGAHGHLGPVGGRIVGEVLTGLIYADPHSVLHQSNFTPEVNSFAELINHVTTLDK